MGKVEIIYRGKEGVIAKYEGYYYTFNYGLPNEVIEHNCKMADISSKMRGKKEELK